MVDDSFWTVAGVSKLLDYEGSTKVTVPNRLFEDQSILTKGRDIQWYINGVTDTVVVSRNDLTDDEYVFVGSTSFADNDNSRTTVPAKLFKDYEGRGSHNVKPEKLKSMDWERNGWIYFIYHSGMDEGQKQSCYAFRQGEFDQRFSDDVLDGVPRFS